MSQSREFANVTVFLQVDDIVIKDRSGHLVSVS